MSRKRQITGFLLKLSGNMLQELACPQVINLVKWTNTPKFSLMNMHGIRKSLIPGRKMLVERSQTHGGLYDMHGNFMEYVQDSWADGYHTAYEDGRAIQKGEGTLRVVRGGSWTNFEKALESAIP